MQQSYCVQFWQSVDNRSKLIKIEMFFQGVFQDNGLSASLNVSNVKSSFPQVWSQLILSNSSCHQLNFTSCINIFLPANFFCRCGLSFYLHNIYKDAIQHLIYFITTGVNKQSVKRYRTECNVNNHIILKGKESKPKSNRKC